VAGMQLLVNAMPDVTQSLVRRLSCMHQLAQHVHIYWISSFSLSKREEGSFCYTVLFTEVVK
jgi:hypothetical protein